MTQAEITQRNNAVIAGLDKDTAFKARQFISNLWLLGIDILLLSGYRTLPEQWELRKKYLLHNGGLAAKPGYSWHNFRRAFDFIEVIDGNIDWTMKNLQHFITAIRNVGLKAGADFSDYDHAQNSIGQNLADYQKGIADIEKYKSLEYDLLNGVNKPNTPEEIHAQGQKDNKQLYTVLFGSALILSTIFIMSNKQKTYSYA